MSDPEQEYWPKYSAVSPLQLHALGVIAFNHNIFEACLFLILAHYVGAAEAMYFFDRMNNEERLAAIREFASFREPDPLVRDRLNHLARFFSICAENRNILMHSFAQPQALTLSLVRYAKGKRLEFHVQLGTLRRIADEMSRGLNFLNDLHAYINARGAKTPTEPVSLPEKPRLPRKINPRQPLVTPQDEPPPPQSSQG